MYPTMSIRISAKTPATRLAVCAKRALGTHPGEKQQQPPQQQQQLSPQAHHSQHVPGGHKQQHGKTIPPCGSYAAGASPTPASALQHHRSSSGGGALRSGRRPGLSNTGSAHSFGTTPRASVSSDVTAAEAQPATAAEKQQQQSGYRRPPEEIARIVEHEPSPSLSFSPTRDRLLVLHRPSMPPIALLARPELKLAGVRLDPAAYSGSRMTSYTGMGMKRIDENNEVLEEMAITGIPEGAGINYASWSPNGERVAFCLTPPGDERVPLELWVADVATMQAAPVLPQYKLNTIFETYTWVDDDVLVASVIPPDHAPPPTKPVAPAGPVIQENAVGQKAEARTYTDLLKSDHDGDVFEHYVTNVLVRLDLSRPDEPPVEISNAAIHTSINPSPDGEYLLVTKMERPFSLSVPCGLFPRRTQLLDATTGTLVREIAALPLHEQVHTSFNSVRPGRRSIGWRADHPAQLYWAETQDGGDAAVEVDGGRDIVYTLSAPFGEETSQPRELLRTQLRYGGISWGDSQLAFVYESWWRTRAVRTWGFSPGDGEGSNMTLFIDRTSEDRYSDPGGVMSIEREDLGTSVMCLLEEADLQMDKEELHLEHSNEKILGLNPEDAGGRYVLMRGEGASEVGDVPFVDLLHLNSGKTQRLWSSQAPKLERIGAIISDDRPEYFGLKRMRFLISSEDALDPAQSYITKFPFTERHQVTDFPHPYPSLRGLQKQILRYERRDGVMLTANLYTPPGYDAERDGPLPVLLWAYPREFKNAQAAGQMRGSPHRFPSIEKKSPLLWLARGWAVLDGPTMPIIGEGDKEANDEFVQQLVDSATAAVQEVVRLGVGTPGKFVVGGHSYGAFMAANLLARAPELFACGIARSGAYNRTLTPFGFQAEERTLWQASDTYAEMSPFMQADKIKKPLLMIHGQDDPNSGTYPMQSERMFNALRGHGVECKLVLLPHEAHHYRARESILHTLAEQDEWMHKYINTEDNAS
mmetsp:Transcript_2726/g.9902  ORF Transcript_2726/g.9902 Transcript_2726/m.9902 type:complete len:983 (+) Transcript_2726:247-3195(+)